MDQDETNQETTGSSLLVTVGKGNPFTVPENYFAELEDTTHSRIRLETLKTGAEGPFSIPEGYFDDLDQKIQARIAAPKVVRLRSWVSYAAAACVTLVIAGALYFNLPQNNFEKQLSAISDDEIIGYLETHSDAGDTDLIVENLAPETGHQATNEDLTDQELRQYLDEAL